MVDRDFGTLQFSRSPDKPEASYWHGSWLFPPTGTLVGINLPGTEDGPTLNARRFYINLAEDFEEIIAACRPLVEELFKTELKRELPQDIFTVVKVDGFNVEDPEQYPVPWEMFLDLPGEKWLILISFVGTTPQEACLT